MPLKSTARGRSLRELDNRLDDGLDGRYQRQLRAAGLGGGRQRMFEPLVGQEAESWKQRVGRFGLDALTAAGSLLDIPGSMSRELQAGVTDLFEGRDPWETLVDRNPLDQLLPSNLLTFGGRSEGTATGRQLLERWGVVGPNVNQGWLPDPGDLAGFAWEVGTDPLTFATSGLSALSKSGRAAKAAGTLQPAVALARREEAIRRAAGLARHSPADLYQTLLNLPDPSVVAKLESKIGKRQARALTDWRHAAEPDFRLLDAQNTGLSPILSPLGPDDLARGELDILRTVASGGTPHTTNPAQQALDQKLQTALASYQKWQPRQLDAAGLPTQAAIHGLDPHAPLFGALGMRIPFSSVGWAPNLRSSRVYMGYAQAMDAFGKAAFDNTVARVIKGQFEPYLKGVSSAAGREVARYARGREQVLIPAVRKWTAQLDRELRRLGETNPLFADENLRGLLTGWAEVNYGVATPQQITDISARIRDYDLRHMQLAAEMGNDIADFQQGFSNVWQELEGVLGVQRPTGGGTVGNVTYGQVPAGMVEHWIPRTWQPSAKQIKELGAQQAARQWRQALEHNKARSGALVGIAGGEETINAMAKDAADWVAQAQQAGQPLDAQVLARHLEGRWGPTGANLVGDAYVEIEHGWYRTRTGQFRRTAGGTPTPKDRGRFEALGRWLLEYEPDQLRQGLLANSPTADLLHAWGRMAESNAASESILKHLAGQVVPVGEGVPLKKVLSELNLRPGNETERGALTYIMERLHPSRAAASADELGNYLVPQRLASDLLAFNDIHRNAKVYDKILDWWDSATNLFKFHATVPFPAFQARNWYGGQWQNAANGMFSKWSHDDARRLLDGELPSAKVLEIPLIRQRLRDAGLPLEQKHGADMLRQLLLEYDVYGDRAFHHNQALGQMARLLEPPGGIDELGASVARREPARQMRQVDPTRPAGEGWNEYLVPRTAAQKAGVVGGKLREYFQGAPDPVTGARNTGAIPMPHAPIPDTPANVSLLGTPWQWLKSRRAMHPSHWSFLGVRGVGSQRSTTFGPGRVMEQASHRIEGYNRVAPFLHQLMNGVDPAEASLRVRAAQIDYSSKNFGQLENDILTRIFPFYKWQSRMLPHVVQLLMEQPGGLQGLGIRASTINQRSAGEDDWIPQRVRDMGLAIPLGSQSPEGIQRYLASVDFPFEGALQPFVFGKGLGQTFERMGRSIGGNLSPLVRVPLESVFGEQLYTGRDIPDVKGGLSTVLANLSENLLGTPPWEASQFQLKLPGMRDDTAKLLENALMGQFGRPISTLRPWTEPSRRRGEGDAGFWAKALLNTLTGVRLADYDIPEEQARELRPKIESELQGNPLVREFSSLYVPREYEPYLRPDDRMLMRLLETLNKERRDASRATQNLKIREGTLPPWAYR